MKVNNPDSMNSLLKCKKIMANYLISKSFLPVSKKDGVYYFAKSKEIEEAYNNAPFYRRVGE